MENEQKAYRYLWIGYVAAILWLLLCNSQHGGDFTVCPTKLIWSIPCPGCGITRATLLFLHGNIAKAIRMNPNVLLSVLFITAFPIVVIIKTFTKIDFIYKTYINIETYLKKKTVLFTILYFEVIVEVHNIVNHI